jgi:hypothetical protein
MGLVVVCFLAVSGDPSHAVISFPHDPLPKLVQLWQPLTNPSNQKFIAADIDHGSLYNTRASFQTAVLIIRAIRKRESFAMDGREEKIMATKVRFTLPLLAAFVFVGLYTALGTAEHQTTEKPRNSTGEII